MVRDDPGRFDSLPIDPDSEAPPGRRFHLTGEALLLVLVGGAVGTASRYGVELLLPHRGVGWPTGTFVINLVGAALLGALLESLTRLGPDSGWRRRARVLVGTGGCGAFTTYSTLALETSLLARDGATATAAGYAIGSVIGGIVAAWLGIVLAASVARRSEAGS
ncbi:fluoride efflux transporter FluC [Williamsia serinedens]|uniref:Fluoride-specific ion channel FluC n=1 Tax=Williamsia serinedens TaxID=391736 RepID=A0ABT1H4Z3_9NOCA|nr:CrcB family protein [Williamsia serinedens]MCP2162251.1 CrcB protein [Williamsia serinedens]